MAGTVTISVVLELGWGMHDLDQFSHLSEDRAAEETALTRLLDTCETLDIELSFLVVGHLLEHSCEGEHDGPYPASWWSRDPGSDYRRDPHFYAPDMIDQIATSDVAHEISTHTYSHILADETATQLIEHELETVRSVHNEYGLSPPRSIVMPRHQHVSHDILAEYDIDTVRRPIDDYGFDGLTPVQKYAWLIRRDHPTCSFEKQNGVVETTCTPHPSLAGTTLPTGQERALPYFRPIPLRVRESLHTRYLTGALDRAANRDSHVHLWTHLYNIANEPQWRAIAPALRRLADLQNNGGLEVARMCDLPGLLS